MLACDLENRIIDFAGGDSAGDRNTKIARRIIGDTVKEWPSVHRWTYLYQHHRLFLNGAFGDGIATVNYTASTRTVTLDAASVLAGYTFPSWAVGASIRINDVVGNVTAAPTSVTLTLDTNIHFADDLPDATGFLLYKDTYQLPSDFLASDKMVAEFRFGDLEYVAPREWLWATRTAEREGTPVYYTFFPDYSSPQSERYVVRVWPFPDVEQTLDFMYSRRLRPVVFFTHSKGSVSVTANSATVTGVGTAFTGGMVGSTIRLSSIPQLPTGIEGVNPPAAEYVIASVQSATSLTLTANASASLSNVGFIVSDPIDVEGPTMATAFIWHCFSLAAGELRMKDRDQVTQNAMSHLLMARDADSRNYGRQVAGQPVGRRRSRRYMPGGPDEG
jgi:hypothetical protein